MLTSRTYYSIGSSYPLIVFSQPCEYDRRQHRNPAYPVCVILLTAGAIL